MASRRPLVAGNWKMNLVRSEGLALVSELIDPALPDDVDVAIFPAFPYLLAMGNPLASSKIGLGAQDIAVAESGAHTGEVSGAMIQDSGASLALIGHSERRHQIGEGLELIRSKLLASVRSSLVPYLCVGETLEQRDGDQTEAVLKEQMESALSGVDPSIDLEIVIAYEPVWAIGTGRNATPEQAQQAHHFLRDLLASWGGQDRAAQTRILYGGSVKPDNARAILAGDDVDGALVGGASLDGASFRAIAVAASSTS